MSKLNFSAVIFDLDGVITQTALVHSAAWKEMFDKYLQFRNEQYNEPFKEFTHKNDYLPYVDGKPRYKGVESFLESRGINIPFGSPDDSPTAESICGLGNRKNQKFNDVLRRDGVKVYENTILLIRELKKHRIRVGVASSSKNCATVLKAANLTSLFETLIDGKVSAELGLKGKPEPDIFTTACDNLNCHYDQTVVVEDAVSGVQAGSRGNFGLVVGVARENNARELRSNGADIVVNDLVELNVDQINNWFREGLQQDKWCLNFHDYQPQQEAARESLCTVGNGYFGTRGAGEETSADNIHYPGTYIARVYNRLDSHVSGKTVSNEDLVNCPNWLPIKFRIGSDRWIHIDEVEIIDFFRQLDMKRGILHRKLIVRDKKGQETLIESSRVASMADPHCAGLCYCVTPLNYSKTITFRVGIEYAVRNAGVKRYRQLENQHLELISASNENNLIYVLMETNQSRIKIAEAVKIRVSIGKEKYHPKITYVKDEQEFYAEITIKVCQGQIINIEKLASIFTSLDIDDPLTQAKQTALSIVNYNQFKLESVQAWESIWNQVDIEITGDRLAQKLIRLNLYHLLITKSHHNCLTDWGIPARGLHGEAYRGHIFWDEIFVLPFYSLHYPEVAKEVLLYRYRRLDQAREYARTNGYQGAMFPWQSGSNGSEETQTYHLNPLSGTWGADNSSLQRHVSIAIAFNVWNNFWASRDVEFLAQYGAEMFLEVARFWASAARVNQQTGRYEIDMVLGPDEFHEQYPNSRKPGLKNNSYTNVMVVWILKKALEILGILENDAKQSVMEKIQLSEEELTKWNDISTSIGITISSDGIIAQFDGYFDLAELDWKKYQKKYGSISRLDRILKVEGESPDSYKVSKQADTLMLFYLLAANELESILTNLGYSDNDGLLKRNFDYYFQRTSHGSTLSLIVHSTLANLVSYDQLAWDLFMQSLASDYNDIQGGTTGEGIHTGVMGGSIMHILRAWAGIDFSKEYLQFNPKLPHNWRSLNFKIRFRNTFYNFIISIKQIQVTIVKSDKDSVEIDVGGKQYFLRPGESYKIALA